MFLNSCVFQVCQLNSTKSFCLSCKEFDFITIQLKFTRRMVIKDKLHRCNLQGLIDNHIYFHNYVEIRYTLQNKLSTYLYDCDRQ